MVKINRSEIIDSLVRGLRLDPAHGEIPSEAASKIVPVFNVKDELENKILASQTKAGAAGSAAIFTSSSTERTFLTELHLSIAQEVAGVGITPGAKILLTPKGGASTSVLYLLLPTNVTANDNGTLQFSKPIEIEPGSLVYVNLIAADANTTAYGTAIGYSIQNA